MIAEKSPACGVPTLEVRRHEERGAMRALVSPLRSAGLLPAPMVEMEPVYLADGVEDHPGTLIAWRGDRPVAFMTYALRHRPFRVALGPVSVGRFPCRQLIVFGYVAFHEDDASILTAFFDTLTARAGWDVIQAFEVPAADALARYLRGTPAVCRTCDTIRVTLAPDFETYLSQQFTRKTRYNLRREVRLLDEAAAGQAAVKVYTSVDDVAEFVRHADAIARRTYQWKLGLMTMQATPAMVDRTTALAAHANWRAYVLFVRAVPVAYCYGTVRRDALSYDVVGYDPRFTRLNPGKVLLYRILEDLHAWRGVGALEFGRGSAEYKRLFANGAGVELDGTLYRAGLYPQILRGLALGAEASYRRLRPVVRPYLPYIKRGLRALGAGTRD